ncbi:hypothetical protein ACYCS5_01810 [Paenibacillus sp. SEL3]|uniref:hypothetical protein n=1 Tax=Paenibacillus TaxID=44249 RepID=UPI0004D34BB8|nr:MULTISPECIES: hypothetical protein [Paenibacillus]KEO79172.1 hypothetical protein EL23_06715 [Paenibacillus polymyxa]MBO3286542.1 hypothetical protein [Paenibacillus polymyxa]MBP1309993.1 hypothetical protein [Paenibacillus sp. 1182]MCH6187165.1 hypothetical protein [Paenibacillus polymyxa]ODB57517.1 hypothetical protein A7311_14685 [Paenibacillus polymyxa]
MQKQCQCGKPMGLELRKVIYADKVEILHVPVFSCSSCFSSEVLQHVTKDIKALLQSLGSKPTARRISFARNNELAEIIRKLVLEEADNPNVDWQSALEERMELRINLLLDLYRYARSLGDEDWMNDVEKKLVQLSGFTSESVFTNTKN